MQVPKTATIYSVQRVTYTNDSGLYFQLKSTGRLYMHDKSTNLQTDEANDLGCSADSRVINSRRIF